MLKLVRIEFTKLRRKKLLWLMLLSAFIMPFFAFLYFNYFGETGIEPVAFYKWSAFGLTMFIILPFVLGMLCTILMYNEQRFDMLKQLWIVPVSRLGYFFSKFFVVLIYSICFMLITAIASVLFSVLPGYVVFEWDSIFFLLKKCLEIALFTAFAMLPVLAIAAVQKSYIMSACVTLIYAFAGFFMTPINMYIHPLSCVSVIIARNGDIRGLTLPQTVHIPMAFLCIFLWSFAATLFAMVILSRRK